MSSFQDLLIWSPFRISYLDFLLGFFVSISSQDHTLGSSVTTSPQDLLQGPWISSLNILSQSPLRISFHDLLKESPSLDLFIGSPFRISSHDLPSSCLDFLSGSPVRISSVYLLQLCHADKVDAWDSRLTAFLVESHVFLNVSQQASDARLDPEKKLGRICEWSSSRRRQGRSWFRSGGLNPGGIDPWPLLDS